MGQAALQPTPQPHTQPAAPRPPALQVSVFAPVGSAASLSRGKGSLRAAGSMVSRAAGGRAWQLWARPPGQQGWSIYTTTEPSVLTGACRVGAQTQLTANGPRSPDSLLACRVCGLRGHSAGPGGLPRLQNQHTLQPSGPEGQPVASLGFLPASGAEGMGNMCVWAGSRRSWAAGSAGSLEALSQGTFP